MQTEQLSRLQLSPVWGKTMNVEFTFQSSPLLFWVLAKYPGRESSARENSHPIVQLSICWVSPGPGTSTSWASQTSDLTRSSVPPRETPKATWGPGFVCCCQRGLQLLRHGQVEPVDYCRSPAAAVAHHPRAPQLSLNIHMRLTGPSPVVSKPPEAAWAG